MVGDETADKLNSAATNEEEQNLAAVLSKRRRLETTEFCHAPNPITMVEMSFYKLLDFIIFKTIFSSKIFKTNIKLFLVGRPTKF